ncbi:MAG: hypothetical protein DME97_11090 [Verrucomicrobia bacterium]|nr:MAG: hypothetical protein DME97_11090 [Verrucomicrobiota bacterium]
MSADENLGETSDAPVTSASEESPDNAPPPLAPNKSDKQTTDGNTGTDKTASYMVMGFWLVVFGLIAYYWFFKPKDQAQVFLEASSQQPFQVSGVVSFKGAPVGNGIVHVVFDDPEKNLYLGGAILSLAEGGKFATGTTPPDPAGSPPNTPAPLRTPVPAESVSSSPPPIRVTATFSGQLNEKDKAPTALSGTATLYLNYPPPEGKWAVTVALMVGGVFAAILIILFTGGLTQRRARFLFALTYITTFLSLAVPIGAIVLVSKSQSAVALMEKAPVGLVKGTAKGVKDPQWLVNLGGAVSPKKTPSEKTTSPPMQTPSGTTSAAAAASPATPPAQQPSPAAPESVRRDELQQRPGFALVEGGLAVPFYVIILAMLGAGINMTKKVPDIQKSYDTKDLPKDEQGMVRAAFNAPIKGLVGGGPRVTTEAGTTAAWGIRKDLIDTYMGLISAPFLAIAVYYLLQIVATNIAEPVLVIAAFATGFISDSIVTAITKIASEWISKGRTGEEKEKEKEKITQGTPQAKKTPKP